LLFGIFVAVFTGCSRRQDAATTESRSGQTTQTQALSTTALAGSPNDLVMLRDFDASLLQVEFNGFTEGMLTREKENPGKGALEFLREHRSKLHDLTVAANLQEKKLSKTNALKTLLSEPVTLTPEQTGTLGQCAEEWRSLMQIYKLFVDNLNKYEQTGERVYLNLFISKMSEFQKIGPPSHTRPCKSW
jgi:hypothetical protein